MVRVSIIIPCKEIDEMTIKCIKDCLDLDYDDFEIIVLPDFTDRKSKDSRLKIIESGKVKPALKRNIGMRESSGEFFAFIDSDAYPRSDWLRNAMKCFEEDVNGEIGIVGGPNLTPVEGNFAEKVSGYALSNFNVSGAACIRYKVSKNQYAKELPSCNYVSRREASSEYDSCFLTAEDSRFCFICSKNGYKILYANDVVVYHHRRDSFKKHLKQMFIYGRDIAWLMKKEFSFDKLYYGILSLFVLLVIAGLVGSFFSDTLRVIYLICLIVYLLIMLFSSFHEELRMSLVVFVLSVGTHFSYGVGWLYGVVVGQGN